MAGMRRSACATLVSGVLAALVLAGCAPRQSGPSSLEPRDVYPVNVTSQMMSYEIQGNGAGTLLPAEGIKLDRYVDEFAAGGHGAIVIETPPAHGPGGDGLAMAIAGRAVERGLAASEVVVRIAPELQGPVRLTYERYFVDLPECRGWYEDPSFNPSNSTHMNFGCATQRNLGMMVADPADLISPATGGTQDAQRAAAILQLYRVGQPTSAETSSQLEATVSSVGE